MIRSSALLALAGCSLCAADPVRIDIPNGDMTAGADKPAGWTATWTGRGKIRVSRDTTVFHTAPAALQVESVDGAAQGNGCCVLDMWADFHDPASPNRVKAELFAKPDGKPDWLHIGPAGYQMWAERIRPLFDDLTR